MDVFREISFAERDEWERLVRSFSRHDVYYLPGYVAAFRLHGDGEPVLLYCEQDGVRAVEVVMKRDIADFAPLAGHLEPGRYYDAVTPYGYGGMLIEGETGRMDMRGFREQYVSFCARRRIVSGFTRFHPVLRNADSMRAVTEVTDLGHTVCMDLESEETIWDNLTSKNRNMIRKARKAGIEIRSGQDESLYEQFKSIYDATMDRDGADAYYYFDADFYRCMVRELKENSRLFYASLDGQIIAMSVFLYCNGQMHYHLSGSVARYRHLAPSNLLLYEAACWGGSHGLRTLHLGGGVGADESGGLYKFKQAFNRRSDAVFSIGRTVFMPSAYDELVELRRSVCPGFRADSGFFPAYRGPETL